MSNNDLRNLKILHKLDIPELHLLNTTIIDYKGYRVLAQSIIPGILSNDHNECTEFGSIDDGKTLHANPEFKELMKKICEYFSLEDEVEFLNEDDTIISLPGSSEIKGIRSSDKKKYILDLMRLSPRDLNWESNNEDSQCCVIRPELISHYLTSKTIEIASNKAKLDLDASKTTSTEEKKEENSYSYADYIKKVQ